MKQVTRGVGLLICALALWGCSGSQSDPHHFQVTQVTQATKANSFFGLGAPARLVAGTALHVALDEQLSAASLHPGDTWRGVVQAPVIVDGDEMIPAGSGVEGVVTDALPPGDRRSLLQVEVRKVFARDREIAVRATAPPVLAGTRRAHDLGLAVETDAGYPRAVSATAGTVAAAPGALAEPAGEAVVLREGAVMSFTVSREVAMR
jgi:hypothetical protein